MEELKNETSDILEDVVEVCEKPVINSGNGLVGVAVGIGVLVLAGVGTYAYNKHKNRQDLDEDKPEKKRKFTLLRNRKTVAEDDEYSEEVE